MKEIMGKKLVLAAVLGFLCAALFAQNSDAAPAAPPPVSTTPVSTTPVSTTPVSTTPVSTTPASTTPAAAGLPVKFRSFTLGMSLDDLKDKLAADPAFLFRGDRDVSFLPLTEQNLVESAGSGFMKRAFFQFKDKKLFIMSFTLNTEKVSHYSVYTSFVKKYGEPKSLNPREAVWENDATRVSIERPLTVKYIDRAVFDSLVDASAASKAHDDEMREEFLNDF